MCRDIPLKTSRSAPRFHPMAATASLLLVTAGSALADTSTQPILSQDVGLPTLTFTFVDTHPVILGGNKYEADQYQFNITGFTVPGGDPADYYTIYSFSNATLQQEVFGVDAYDLPQGWSFDPTDFTISTPMNRGIHATDPTFGLILYETPGQGITPADAPFEIFHETDGVQPFTLDGKPVIITAQPLAQPVPESGTGLTFGLGLLALSGLLLHAHRKRKAA